VSAWSQCLSSGTRALHTTAAHTCSRWPACLEAGDAWTGYRRHSHRGCRMHLLTQTPSRPGTAAADSPISAREKNTDAANRVQGYTGCTHSAVGPTPPPQLLLLLHSIHPVQPKCCVVCASPAHSATRARAHAHQPTACCFTVSRSNELHTNTTPHRKPCNMSRHERHRFPWLPLARRELMHSCQPLSTTHTRRNSTHATRNPVTSTQKLRHHRSAHMDSMHNKHTCAAHRNPSVGSSRPCRLNCTCLPPELHVTGLRAWHGGSKQQQKRLLQCFARPRAPLPSLNQNHETLALPKLQQQYTANKGHTLPNTRTASCWHLNSTSRQANKTRLLQHL
jgi:hypothetical protein